MKISSLLIVSVAALAAVSASAQSRPKPGLMQPANPIQHVLLISIDGMHAVDYRNCSQGISRDL